ncbi:MAG: DUF3175 domain-containing protein [Gemmatimonadales bacterium]
MSAKPRRTPKRSKKAARGTSGASGQQRWSRRVTRTSDALDLEQGVFSQRSAKRVALSLKRSAERSRRRKSEPFRSAMSMLNLYINRAGRKLSPERKRVLTQAKTELRKVFNRPTGEKRGSRRS